MVATAAANESTEVKKIVKGHYQNQHDFSTLNIRANAKYEDEKQSHAVNADIRIKKDEIIWFLYFFWSFPLVLTISSLYELSNPETKSNFPWTNCKNSLCLSGKKVMATASR